MEVAFGGMSQGFHQPQANLASYDDMEVHTPQTQHLLDAVTES
jgi:hypothetical protein